MDLSARLKMALGHTPRSSHSRLQLRPKDSDRCYLTLWDGAKVLRDSRRVRWEGAEPEGLYRILPATDWPHWTVRAPG